MENRDLVEVEGVSWKIGKVELSCSALAVESTSACQAQESYHFWKGSRTPKKTGDIFHTIINISFASFPNLGDICKILKIYNKFIFYYIFFKYFEVINKIIVICDPLIEMQCKIMYNRSLSLSLLEPCTY